MKSEDQLTEMDRYDLLLIAEQIAIFLNNRACAVDPDEYTKNVEILLDSYAELERRYWEIRRVMQKIQNLSFEAIQK